MFVFVDEAAPGLFYSVVKNIVDPYLTLVRSVWFLSLESYEQFASTLALFFIVLASAAAAMGAFEAATFPDVGGKFDGSIMERIQVDDNDDNDVADPEDTVKCVVMPAVKTSDEEIPKALVWTASQLKRLRIADGDETLPPPPAAAASAAKPIEATAAGPASTATLPLSTAKPLVTTASSAKPPAATATPAAAAAATPAAAAATTAAKQTPAKPLISSKSLNKKRTKGIDMSKMQVTEAEAATITVALFQMPTIKVDDTKPQQQQQQQPIASGLGTPASASTAKPSASAAAASSTATESKGARAALA
jgi:hypothetical protein